ncbi:MAG TPA: hypothetical protein VIF62_07625, partial [Labilithrix sp.]
MSSKGVRIAFAIVVCTGAARAQDRDPVAAQALFDDAKRLMQAGDYAHACPKFAESQKLDPAGGTLIALALCNEGQGKTASAWEEFNEALSEARRDKRADRESAATEHLKKLEPRLVRVRIVAPEIAGLEVRRDGVLLGSAQWSTPVPVDPGAHVFEARAPKKKTWSASFDVQGEGKVVDVTIPTLADEAQSAIVTPLPPPPPPPNRDPPTHDEPQSDGSTQRVLGLALGGVGIVATGIGVVLGVSASSKWSDAQKACPQNKCQTSSQIDAGKSAGSTADAATAFYVIGA